LCAARGAPGSTTCQPLQQFVGDHPQRPERAAPARVGADKAFLSGAGCDPDFGVSGANLDIAREIILVADASKFSKGSMVRIASFSEIDTIISDTGLRSEVQEKVRGFGCNLILS
jgi:DeoR/GlpR family transcriptional regulator of sugar metabolism